MKIGDLIARKDMPWIAYRIVSENKNWNAWNVELLAHLYSKGLRKKGMIMKDDDRWVTINGS